jgi:hypothetical protein
MPFSFLCCTDQGEKVLECSGFNLYRLLRVKYQEINQDMYGLKGCQKLDPQNGENYKDR